MLLFNLSLYLHVFPPIRFFQPPIQILKKYTVIIQVLKIQVLHPYNIRDTAKPVVTSIKHSPILSSHAFKFPYKMLQKSTCLRQSLALSGQFFVLPISKCLRQVWLYTHAWKILIFTFTNGFSHQIQLSKRQLCYCCWHQHILFDCSNVRS